MLLDAKSDTVRNRILLILWQSWHLRNNVIHGDGKDTVSSPVHFLVRYEEDVNDSLYSDVTEKDKCHWSLYPHRSSNPTAPASDHWSAPAKGMVKLNTDASYISKTGESWIGAVARDHRGQVFVAVCQKLNKCSSVEEAEAEAALIGLKELANCTGGWSLWKSTALLSARNCTIKERTERSVSLWWQTLIKPLPSLLTAP